MNNFLSFQVHGGESGGGIAALVVNFLEFLERLSGKTPPEVFHTLMPGLAALENIHPLFVHFPIALFCTFLIVDVTGTVVKNRQWRSCASCLLYLGTFATAFTVFAGLIAADSVEHNDVVHEIMERHEKFGTAVLALSLFLSGWRMKRWGLRSASFTTLFHGLSSLLCVLVLLGADLGGLMVYQYGVAVKASGENMPSSVSAEPAESHPGNETANDHHRGSHDHHHDGHGHAH